LYPLLLLEFGSFLSPADYNDKVQSNDGFRGPIELVQHSLVGGSSHRRNGAARHFIDMVGYIARLSQLWGRGDILFVQMIPPASAVPCENGWGGGVSTLWVHPVQRSNWLFNYMIYCAFKELCMELKSKVCHNFLCCLGIKRELPPHQGIKKRCRLFWMTNSALVYEPKCGGREGVAGSQGQPMSTAVHRSQNKLWRSNSIFNLCSPSCLWVSLLAVWQVEALLEVGGRWSHFNGSKNHGLSFNLFFFNCITYLFGIRKHPFNEHRNSCWNIT
jgi:hypothetical protein